MSKVHRKSSHTASWLTVHLIFVTKYRYKVLRGDIQKRCRELMRQDCDRLDLKILSGVVSSDHLHLHVEYPPKLSISEICKQLKGRSSRRLQEEFPHLRKRYWGQRFWSRGYGAFSSGNITEEMVQNYIKGHAKNPNKGGDNFFLE